MADPEILAQLLRRRQQSGLLQDANTQAHQFDELAAIAQMANNPGAAAATSLAARQSQGRYKPMQMGTQGFSLPSSGEFIESPMYVDEKNAARSAVAENQASRLAQSAAAAAEREDRIRSEGEKSRTLQQTLAQMSDATRRSEGAANRALRETLGVVGGERQVAARDKDFENRVTNLSKSFDKSETSKFLGALANVEQTLAQFPAGKDIPGFGRMESFKPDWALSPEAMSVRQDMAIAANALLHAQSGAAVTEPEMRRFLTAMAMGKAMDEKSVRRGWENVRTLFDAKVQNLVSGAPADVLKEYNLRAGTDFEHVPNGVSYKVWRAMTPEEKSTFRKGGK